MAKLTYKTLTGEIMTCDHGGESEIFNRWLADRCTPEMKAEYAANQKEWEAKIVADPSIVLVNEDEKFHDWWVKFLGDENVKETLE